MSENPNFPTDLTVADLLRELADADPSAVVSVCHDRTHAVCDIISNVHVDDKGRATLGTYHPSNVNGDYPFREEIVWDLVQAAKRIHGVAEWRNRDNAAPGEIVGAMADVVRLAEVLDKFEHDPYHVVYFGPQHV